MFLDNLAVNNILLNYSTVQKLSEKQINFTKSDMLSRFSEDNCYKNNLQIMPDEKVSQILLGNDKNRFTTQKSFIV